jgi:hypothetical protein
MQKNMFGKKEGFDPDYDLKLEESLEKNEYLAEKIAKANASEHTSLCAKMCTQEVCANFLAEEEDKLFQDS